MRGSLLLPRAVPPRAWEYWHTLWAPKEQKGPLTADTCDVDIVAAATQELHQYGLGREAERVEH